MKDRLNVIKINGFTGIFIAVFLLGCAIEGLIVFPGRIVMYTWNFIASYVDNMPVMTLIHGVILWAIIALSAYAILKNKKPITYHSPSIISDEDIKRVLENAKNMDTFTSVRKEEKSEEEIKH